MTSEIIVFLRTLEERGANLLFGRWRCDVGTRPQRHGLHITFSLSRWPLVPFTLYLFPSTNISTRGHSTAVSAVSNTSRETKYTPPLETAKHFFSQLLLIFSNGLVYTISMRSPLLTSMLRFSLPLTWPGSSSSMTLPIHRPANEVASLTTIHRVKWVSCLRFLYVISWYASIGPWLSVSFLFRKNPNGRTRPGLKGSVLSKKRRCPQWERSHR